MEGLKNLPGEIWKDVPGYEGLYKVSNMGRVFNLISNKFLKLQKSDQRPAFFNLRKGDGVKYFNAPKLVYQTFTGDYSLKIYLIPRDGDFLNIALNNLIPVSLHDRRKGCTGNIKYTVGLIIGHYKILERIQDATFKFRMQCITCGDVFTTQNPKGKHRCSCACPYKVGVTYGTFKVLRSYTDRTSNKVYRYLDLLCVSCGDIITRYNAANFDPKHIVCLCRGKSAVKHYRLKDNRSLDHIYHVWYGIRQRCYNENNPSFKYYGAKGIFLCDYWFSDFSNFKRWYITAEENARTIYGDFEYKYKDGENIQVPILFTVERLNPNGPYAPWNCIILPHRINSNFKYQKAQSEKYPKEGLLRIQTDAELRKQRRTWYKEALERGEIDAKYYRKQITRLD